jgi:hypothetical protein
MRSPSIPFTYSRRAKSVRFRAPIFADESPKRPPDKELRKRFLDGSGDPPGADTAATTASRFRVSRNWSGVNHLRQIRNFPDANS